VIAVNFGQIKEQVENDIGASLPTSTLGRWVNAGQIEISKRYGNRIRFWYPPPLTYLSHDTARDETEILVVDGLALPEPPDVVLIGDGGLYEVVEYADGNHRMITGVQRGLDGEAQNWPAGTAVRPIAVTNAEYDLPADIMTLHEVRNNRNKPVFKRHATADGKIAVFEPGMYYIIYTRVPERIDHEDDNAELEIHPVFHNDIITFCLAKYWQSIAEGIPGEEQKAQMLMGEFTRSVEMSAKHLNRLENQQYTIGYELPF
jgi:hypothetical protein